MKAFTFIETLATIAIIALLASLLLAAISRSLRHAKAWIWGSYHWQEARIEAFLGDDDAAQLYYTTNTVQPWTLLTP